MSEPHEIDSVDDDPPALVQALAESIERARADRQFQERLQRNMAKHRDLLARLAAERTTDSQPSTPGSPVTVRGFLGWGNPGSGDTVSSLDCYGPGGRWESGGRKGQAGDPLADALHRAGCHEGARLIVLAWDRFEPIPETLTIRPAEILRGDDDQ